MAYGSPATRTTSCAYYTDIRRGRPPTDEQLADLTRRYEAIGGLSPLRGSGPRRNVQAVQSRARSPRARAVRRRARAQALRADDRGRRRRARRAGRGTESSAPCSRRTTPAYSVGQYLERLADAAAPLRHRGSAGIESWAIEPAFVELPGRRSRRPAGTRCPPRRASSSPPTRCRRGSSNAGDPYPDRAARDGRRQSPRKLGLVEGDAVGARRGRAPAARRAVAAPDILSGRSIDSVPIRRSTGVLVCACGFVADHLEVLYDLDIEARRRADGGRPARSTARRASTTTST